jgi:hypothetical protein
MLLTLHHPPAVQSGTQLFTYALLSDEFSISALPCSTKGPDQTNPNFTGLGFRRTDGTAS